MTYQPELLVAAIQQLLLAATFIAIPIVAQKFGEQAQSAAEKSVTDQGLDGQLLSKNGIKFSESKLEMLLPFAFAAAYIVTALLILTRNDLGRTLTWIIEPVTLVIVGLVTANQVFATSFMQRAFKKSGNVGLQKVDVEKFVVAALKEFPSWLRPLQVVRFLAATVGSVIVLMLLIF